MEIKENRDDRYIMDAANDDPCSDPVAIRMMIQFMYSGDYNLGLDPRGKLALKDLPEVPSKFNEARALPEEYRDMGNGRLDLHLKLFVLGDKYNIPSLMTLAVSTVRSDIQWQVWNDIAVRDLLANMHKWSPQHDTSFQEMMCVMLLRRRANGKTWSNVVDEQIEIMPGFGLLLFKQFTDNVIQVPAIAKMISDASDETTYITKEQYWWNKKQDSTSPASIVPQPTATYEGSSRKRFAR